MVILLIKLIYFNCAESTNTSLLIYDEMTIIPNDVCLASSPTSPPVKTSQFVKAYRRGNVAYTGAIFTDQYSQESHLDLY